MMKTILAALSVAAALLLAPQAHADNFTDNDVLAYAVTAADAVCKTINDNPTVAGVQTAIDLVKGASGFSLLHSATVVNRGVIAKCMDRFPLLHQWAITPPGTDGVTNYDAPGAPDVHN